MSITASQIRLTTLLFIQQLDQSNYKTYQSTHCWSFVRGIHQWSMDSPYKGPVMWKVFPCHDIIMLPLKMVSELSLSEISINVSITVWLIHLCLFIVLLFWNHTQYNEPWVTWDCWNGNVILTEFFCHWLHVSFRQLLVQPMTHYNLQWCQMSTMTS